MDAFIAGVVRAAVEVFPIPKPILEVGSQSMPGQEHLANRHLFPEKHYVGIDLRPGPGVDSVENIEQLQREDNSVGTVLALNVFEHVKHFWRGFAEIERVLRPDGLAIISCPFHCHIHAYPNDYWRFTPEALRLLLESLPTKIIGYNGPRRRPLNVWAVAAGPEYPGITDSQHDRFFSGIQQFAHYPISWQKQLRYRLGRVFCGSRPLGPFLEINHFDTQLFEDAKSLVRELVDA